MFNAFGLRWTGIKPTQCDICHIPLVDVFYDAKTRNGQWGCVCDVCFMFQGCKLGTGNGQEYKLQNNGDFVKTAG